ncbi:MAG: glycosyltransferase family 39 protein [Acidobacteriota bacterium]|nr:glycosyltransferase family 39 protein [Acidobacteriota bacterium]
MRVLKALVAASAVLLFLGLDASTIWDANEAYYTETPRQMILTGDYVNPSFNGAPRFNKPVLNYWIVAAFYKLLGVSVWAERVAIALGALGIAASAGVIARVIANPRAGWIAALVLLTAPRVVFFARRIFIDVYVTLFMSLVLMFFVLAEARPHHRRRYLLLMYAAAGLGLLTKGPVAVVLPALAFLLYLVIEGRWREIWRMQLIAGAAIVLAIAAPWYYLVYAQHGWGYIQTFFVGENIGRYSETFGEQHRSVFFYIPVLLTDLFPWALFAPAALWAAWRQRAPLMRLMLCWIGVIVGVFTFSSTKQDLYILPIAAALAASVAVFLERANGGEQPDAIAARRTWPVIGVLMVALWLLLQQMFGTTGSRYFISGAFYAGLFLLAGGFTVFAYWRARAPMETVLALGASFVAANYMLVLVSLPAFERFKPVAPLSAAALARGAGAQVIQYRTPLPSMVWYLNRPIEEVLDLPVLQERLARPGETLVMLKESDYAEVQTIAPTCVIARRPLMDVKPREIMAGTALPEMLLISNRCE